MTNAEFLERYGRQNPLIDMTKNLARNRTPMVFDNQYANELNIKPAFDTIIELAGRFAMYNSSKILDVYDQARRLLRIKDFDKNESVTFIMGIHTSDIDDRHEVLERFKDMTKSGDFHTYPYVKVLFLSFDIIPASTRWPEGTPYIHMTLKDVTKEINDANLTLAATEDDA